MLDHTDEDLRYFLALALAPKIGPGSFKAILAYAGSVKNFFQLSRGKASKIPRGGDKIQNILGQESQLLRLADALINDSQKKGFEILTSLNPKFPQRLKLQADSPVVFFSKGNFDFNLDRTVGIVGTRSATTYGKAATRKIIEDLTLYQPAIISGLAYGIDIEAHRMAIQAGLPTVAVMGSPIDQIYPPTHTKTAIQLQENGALISEYSPGIKMSPGNFPARNRIIAALADALIVVEAAVKGGALITAEIAFSYHKEVFAVPGNLQSPFSEGCNLLIKRMKANIYTGPGDVAEALFWCRPGEENKKRPALDLSNRSDEEIKILNLLLENSEFELDQMSYKTAIPMGQLSSTLLALEFEGIIKSLPGKKYKLMT